MFSLTWLVLGSIVFLFVRSWLKNRNLVFPPGPKPAPVVGNIFDLSSKHMWLYAKKWAEDFGAVTYLHVFGQGLVFLNTSEAAFDLLEKKGSIYSDKPGLTMAGELCGCENMVAFARYGTQSRSQRKIMNKALSASAVRRYEPLIEAETHNFVRRLVKDPKDYIGHIRRYAGGLTLNTIYGYRVTQNNDHFLELAEECVNLLSNKIASTGSLWIVDILPFLKHIPSNWPGASFKRKAAVWKAKMEEFVEKPWDYFTSSMANGTAPTPFCSTAIDADALQNKEKSDLEKQVIFDIKWTANSMYSGSIDTTITAIMHFMLAMLLHPEVMKKAQEEMDRVVLSEGRLPTFEDRAKLPYLESIMSEILRWGVPVPINLPHRLMEDDIYNGMFLRKGTLVFGNVWAMVRDETLYPDAHSFKPERFMPENTKDFSEETKKRMDPRNYCFGFGRRICPGRNLIEASGWFLMATIVATLDITKCHDAEGNVIEPKVEFNNAVFRIPDYFECDIRPRSELAIKLLAQSELASA